jgi:prepilin-type processing-associated H-X9-DG protein
MYAQDNDEMLPTAATVWGKLDLPPKIYQCPTVKLTQSYAYSPRCDAMALGDLPNPSATWVTADGDAEGFDLRHNGKPVSSYLDGHAELSYPYVVFTPINANAPCYTPYLVGHTIDGSGLSAPVNSGDAMSANSWPTHTATANPASSPSTNQRFHLFSADESLF